MIDAFYSDPHLGHANIIKHAKRPFRNLDEMHASLISLYNLHVGSNDVVVWCGDVFWTAGAASLLRHFNGHKILVLGNHDKSAARMAHAGFDLVVEDWLSLHIEGRPARICHYPYLGADPTDDRYRERRPERRRGEVLIHGHTHEKARRVGNRIHVGVDAWDYRPALYSEVRALVREVPP